jgi:hypothetical protein
MFYKVLGEGNPAGIMVLPIHTVVKNTAMDLFRRHENVPVAKVFNGSHYVVSGRSANSIYEKLSNGHSFYWRPPAVSSPLG